MVAGARAVDAAVSSEPGDLASLSLEELGEVEITSVSRRAERLSAAAASVYVIGREEILRSGAVRLPEVLRLAPNLQVARVSSTQYAISARGFNNSLGNKLLVLVDGRTVYTPLFSGVFWDSQDLLLEDVDRIEVISGPGAALWGANAVNGVINIITLPASETQGLFVRGYGGGEGEGVGARAGGRLGPTSFRVYAKRDRVAATEAASGTEIANEWDSLQGGFRADAPLASGSLTIQGDAYRGESDPLPVFGSVEISGANVLGRWERTDESGSQLRIQGYFDRSERVDRLTFDQRLEILDLEFQHGFERGRQRFLWGGGLRHARDDTRPALLVTFVPEDRTLDWSNLFVQDEVALRSDLDLTLGARFDRNDYTGTEFLPNLRLAWRSTEQRLFWAAASRAVRAPARIDREFFFPGAPPFLILGGPDFESEVSNVIELGFRAESTAKATLSMTAFHHVHDKLRSGQPSPDGTFRVENGIEGTTSGIEAWGSVQAGPRLRLSAGLVVLDQDLELKPGSLDTTGPSALGNDPEIQAQLRAALEVTTRLDLDLMVRYVGELPEPRVPSYTAADLRVGLRLLPGLELSLAARNLLDSGHAEFHPGALTPQSELGRTITARLRWLP